MEAKILFYGKKKLIPRADIYFVGRSDAVHSRTF